MDLRSVANIVGYLLGILALAMLVPAAYELLLQSPNWTSFRYFCGDYRLCGHYAEPDHAHEKARLLRSSCLCFHHGRVGVCVPVWCDALCLW